jgi:SAM-dependent methyltransferase
LPRYDRHALYEASVQSVDSDVAFFAGVYRRKRGRPARMLREDFCGTAALSAAWLRLHRDNRAVGVDLDPEVLAWAREHRLPKMGDAASRLSLVRADVRSNRVPKADLTLALNFSYCVFKERRDLLGYVRAAREGLKPGGLLVLNVFGGTEAMETLSERSRKKGFVQDDGTRVPSFTYVWEHERFNPIDHHLLCHIHYEFPDGSAMRNAFTYDWRLWTLPELRELCAEAGFASTDVYLEGWDDEANASSHVYRKRTHFENQAGWLAYVMAWA